MNYEKFKTRRIELEQKYVTEINKHKKVSEEEKGAASYYACGHVGCKQCDQIQSIKNYYGTFIKETLGVADQDYMTTVNIAEIASKVFEMKMRGMK